jgi:hypothetical protein
MRVAPTRPEGHPKADQEHCSQNQKECRLFDPRDRRDRQSHSKAEKADLKRQKIDSGEKSAKERECAAADRGC